MPGVYRRVPRGKGRRRWVGTKSSGATEVFATGAVSGSGVLAATATVTHLATGAVTGSGVVAGSATVTHPATGAVTGTGTFIGTATVTSLGGSSQPDTWSGKRPTFRKGASRAAYRYSIFAIVGVETQSRVAVRCARSTSSSVRSTTCARGRVQGQHRDRVSTGTMLATRVNAQSRERVWDEATRVSEDLDVLIWKLLERA